MATTRTRHFSQVAGHKHRCSAQLNTARNPHQAKGEVCLNQLPSTSDKPKTTGTPNLRHRRAFVQEEMRQGPKAGSKRYWSADAMRRSDALDLNGGVFRMNNAREIVIPLKRSSARSERRKGTPYQSAMSMLNFTSTRLERS